MSDECYVQPALEWQEKLRYWGQKELVITSDTFQCRPTEQKTELDEVTDCTNYVMHKPNLVHEIHYHSSIRRQLKGIVV